MLVKVAPGGRKLLANREAYVGKLLTMPEAARNNWRFLWQKLGYGGLDKTTWKLDMEFYEYIFTYPCHTHELSKPRNAISS